ncbi:hypothetical protein V2J09_008097 [Rumex salicifolius]
MAAIATPHRMPVSAPCVSNWKKKKRGKVVVAAGNFEHFFGAVKKDMEFMKKGISKGVEWANETLKLPMVAKKVDDFVWLRQLENPNSPPFDPPNWPQPHYSALSGWDLLMADLEALEAYTLYFYCLSKVWSRPLPESYDPQEVATYFNCRPHLIAFRLLEVFSAFSFAAIKIRASRLTKLFKSSANDDPNGSSSQYDFGIVLKETMLSLGPTFIKVGQSLSTRPDIIGSDISKTLPAPFFSVLSSDTLILALSGLHDQIPPFPRSLAMKILEEELGSPVEQYFSYISEEPAAAASFGQVYRGITHDGCAVAIKVQRPNLHPVVVRDVYILRLGLGLLQKVAKRENDPRLYADELGKGLIGELDYRLEAANATQFSDAHASFPFIYVPKVYPNLTRKRMLTMEWVVGENPNDLVLVSTGASVDCRPVYSDKQKFEAKQRLLDLVTKGVEASLVQLLETGLLHADPHPGNLRYTTSGQIGFLDFGLMCRMEKKHQLAMLASIVHIVNGDWASLVDALLDMDIVKPGTNTRRVTLELENSLGEVQFNEGIPDVKFSKVLGKIWSLALKYHFKMPPYYTLVLRSLASLEGLAIAADDDFKTFEAAYPYVVRKLLTDNSYTSRKILHSVVLNNKGEFQWQRLGLFLRVGATRNGLQKLGATNNDASPKSSAKMNRNTFSTANFVLRLLPSKDGVVIRRLLMTANGASLLQAMLSKEAVVFRQQICQGIADVIYKWMMTPFVKDHSYSSYNHLTGPTFSNEYESILRDRRLKVILIKILADTRKDTLLFLRFCCTSLVTLVSAFAISCHRFVVSLSTSFIGQINLAPTQVAVST